MLPICGGISLKPKPLFSHFLLSLALSEPPSPQCLTPAIFPQALDLPQSCVCVAWMCTSGYCVCVSLCVAIGVWLQ